jgi:hypothetical protein
MASPLLLLSGEREDAGVFVLAIHKRTRPKLFEIKVIFKQV